jgi:Glycosyltransferase family 87
MNATATPAPAPEVISQPRAISPSGSKRAHTLVFVLLGISAIVFIVRGPVRFATEGLGWNDFLPEIVQARAWVQGADPYRASELVRHYPKDAVQFEFLAKEAADGTLAAKRGLPSPYPLTNFVLLASLSFLSWHAIHAIWLCVMLASVAIAICSSLSLAGLHWDGFRTYVYLALVLALAPIHTAIATGNVVLPTFALAMAGVWASRRNRPFAAGVLIALAICLKPSIGIVFLAYYLVRRDWAIVLTGTGLTIAIAALGAVRLLFSGVHYAASYRSAVVAIMSRGAINDFTTANPMHYQLLNLQMPLFSLTANMFFAQVMAWAAAAVLFAIWFRYSVRDPKHWLLQLSTLSVIALLPVYHRFVDAVLLVLPLCWVFSASADRCRKLRFCAGLLAAIFILPGPALLTVLADRNVFFATLTRLRVWDAVLIAHQAWALFGLAVVLVAAQIILRRRALVSASVTLESSCAELRAA